MVMLLLHLMTRLGVLKYKMTTVRVIPVPFRVLSRKKNMTRTSFVLEFVPLRGENKYEPCPQKRFWYLLGVIFQNSDDHPRHLYMGVPPPWGFCSLHLNAVAEMTPISLHQWTVLTICNIRKIVYMIVEVKRYTIYYLVNRVGGSDHGKYLAKRVNRPR